MTTRVALNRHPSHKFVLVKLVNKYEQWLTKFIYSKN